MVKGLDVFAEFFKGYEDSYILIGGAASHLIEEANLLVPRATKDLDLILVVEALTDDFVLRFWQFVKRAGYVHKQKGTEKTEFFRFYQPSDSSYPFQIELLSRRPDLITVPDDVVIAPIPTGEEVSSLSAIMLDDSYYRFTLENSTVINGVHIAESQALICLKAKAYMNLKSLKESGKSVNSSDIAKHKNDVIRLGATLPLDARYLLPDNIRSDLSAFMEKVKDDLPDEGFARNMGAGDSSVQRILDFIKVVFLQ